MRCRFQSTAMRKSWAAWTTELWISVADLSSLNAISSRDALRGAMAASERVPPSRARDLARKVVRVPCRAYNVAAIACVLLVYAASNACGSGGTMAATRAVLSSAGSPIQWYAAQTDYTQGYVPEKRSGDGLVTISSRRLVLYYEIPMLLVSLAIGIGALVSRGRRKQHNVSSCAAGDHDDIPTQVLRIRL